VSTATPLLHQDNVNDFCAALREWPNSETSNESFALAVTHLTTIYFHYEPQRHLEASLKLVDLHEAYEGLLGRPYVVATHPDSERPHPYGSKRLPDLRVFASKTPIHKQFAFNVSDEKNPLSSPSRAGYFWRSSTWDDTNNNAYSSVQLHHSFQWWLDHRVEWQQFILNAADRLLADQVYSGFAMGNPLDIGARYEVAVWERALAPHFYGLDIDFPFSMARPLQEGIRPPTWGFLLSNRWREKLGLTREQVRASLPDARIRVDEIDAGQWIELGPQPSLLPVEDGLPPLQMMLNRLLKPIRLPELGLVGFGQWDGDPNERFTLRDSQRWLARFDEDGDWPSVEIRNSRPSAAARGHAESVPANRPCPRTGWWLTPAGGGTRQHFEQGQIMPAVGGDYGATIWQWDERQ
jgi:Protein of unknown function (DUF3396)